MKEAATLVNPGPIPATGDRIRRAASRKPAVRIDIERLSLSFGATQVLKGIDLTVEAGEFFAFLGPSGSGKSTLLRAIAGFGPAPEGRILVGGEDIGARPPWQRDVGMVFQSYALWPHLSVARNVAYGLEERHAPREEIRRRVAESLELVGMAQFAARYPAQLSGGQQQRVALARTIAAEPRVLLLDEPLSNLDAGLRVQMREELLALQRALGITTIFVTHDQEEANSICDRIAVMAGGVIQQVGRPVEIYDHPGNEFVARFLGAANLIAGRAERDGSRGVRFRSAEGGFELSLTSDAALGGGHLMIRPQGFDLVEADGPAAAGAGVQTVRAVVRSSEFLGGVLRYSVTAERGVALIVDVRHDRGRPALQAGQSIGLSLRPEQALFIAS
jgi:iron(III) transport system ATP-binding protein